MEQCFMTIYGTFINLFLVEKEKKCSMTASTRSEYKKGKLDQRIYSTPQSATEKCKKRQFQALFYAFQNIDIVTRTRFMSIETSLEERYYENFCWC